MILNPTNRFLFSEAVIDAPPGGGGPAPAPAAIIAPPAAPVAEPPAPAPVAEPISAPAASLFTEDGKLGKDWFLKLGDQFAPHAADLGKITDIRTLLTERDYFRKNGVEYPAADAQPQTVDRFRKIAGVPDTADGYGLTAEKMQLPAGMEFDSELANAVMAAAHKTHTPPAALQAIVGEFNTLLAKRTADAVAAEAQAKQAAQDALVAEWRGDFTMNSSTARHMANKLGESAGLPVDSPEVSALANTPAFAKMMLAVSKMFSEDGVTAPAGFGDMRAPADRIAAIESGTDPQWGQKYTKGTTQERQEAYEYVKSLREKAAR